ncbi:hypothetical protein B0J12DRAFT_302596 [Macrophomina phaseolina]|uniref:Uncharacterized protein n=1 Tax=Macrophomina phaseolina TaxID=35725 RepID=A0ABQ8FXC1_9PEZI|nr:hypothetical protein B0J12DRAFT_302596 [Macrophomina phaseolina]
MDYVVQKRPSSSPESSPENGARCRGRPPCLKTSWYLSLLTTYTYSGLSAGQVHRGKHPRSRKRHEQRRFRICHRTGNPHPLSIRCGCKSQDSRAGECTSFDFAARRKQALIGLSARNDEVMLPAQPEVIKEGLVAVARDNSSGLVALQAWAARKPLQASFEEPALPFYEEAGDMGQQLYREPKKISGQGCLTSTSDKVDEPQRVLGSYAGLGLCICWR